MRWGLTTEVEGLRPPRPLTLTTEKTYFTFLSDLKNMTFYVFLEMTYQKVVKSLDYDANVIR